MSTQPENELSTQKPAEAAEWKPSLEDAIERLHELADWAAKAANGSLRPMMLANLVESFITYEPAAPFPAVAPPTEARIVRMEARALAIQILAMTGRADITVRQALDEATRLIIAYYAACRSKEVDAVSAIQLTDDLYVNALLFVPASAVLDRWYETVTRRFVIKTDAGEISAKPGDWIVRDAVGAFHVCRETHHRRSGIEDRREPALPGGRYVADGGWVRDCRRKGPLERRSQSPAASSPAVAPPITQFLKRLGLEYGAIVSSASCDEQEIFHARATGRFFVDDDSLGYVIRSAHWRKIGEEANGKRVVNAMDSSVATPRESREWLLDHLANCDDDDCFNNLPGWDADALKHATDILTAYYAACRSKEKN